MTKIPSDIGALILAGGKNRRMNGRHKALLPLHDNTLIEHLAFVLDNFNEKIISTGVPELAKMTGFTPVADKIPEMGPLGGLDAALSVCRSQALVVCACDMPCLTTEFVTCLAGLACEYPDAPAIILKDRSGQIHPLCGLYRTSAGPTIHSALRQNERRVMRVFDQLDGIIIPLSEIGFPDTILTNINTLPDLELMPGSSGQPR